MRSLFSSGQNRALAAALVELPASASSPSPRVDLVSPYYLALRVGGVVGVVIVHLHADLFAL